jgi:hypothetical protein
MSLAMFIHTGMFPNRTDRDNSKVKTRNVCIEHTFKDWKDYLLSSTKMLSAPDSQSNNYEMCDCYRPQTTQTRGVDLSSVFDNRYYRNQDANVSLSFISVLHEDPRMRFNPPEFEYTNPDWSGPISDMLQRMKSGAIPLPKAKPTIIAWNSGIFKVYAQHEYATVRQIAHAARELVDSSGHPRPRLFWKESVARNMWKGATACNLLDEDLTMKKILVREHGWEVLPYARITAPFMHYYPRWAWPNMSSTSPYYEMWWDTVHANPYVYEELNQVLLRQICDE